nr:FAD-binding oxidoreductase [Micromonospora sp. DSM 115978]
MGTTTRDLDAAFVVALHGAVGVDHVLTDPELTAGYAVDWTGAYRGRAGAVVRPADAAQVRQVVLTCAEHRVSVVPQGGNTGLVGGSVPYGAAAGAVVLSLRRLDAVHEPDPAAGLVTAQAGATLAAVQRRVRASGFE